MALIACSSDAQTYTATPADFSGSYTVSVTNTDNGCNYQNWTVGNTAQNVAFDIAQQSDGSATGNVKGLANLYFAALGIGTFTGTVQGTHTVLTAVGNKNISQGACSYYVKATIDITLTGDTINGKITYSNSINSGTPTDCGSIATCSSTQSVAGSRPPKQ